jgi:hypothetical protein
MSTGNKGFLMEKINAHHPNALKLEGQVQRNDCGPQMSHMRMMAGQIGWLVTFRPCP